MKITDKLLLLKEIIRRGPIGGVGLQNISGLPQSTLQRWLTELEEQGKIERVGQRNREIGITWTAVTMKRKHEDEGEEEKIEKKKKSHWRTNIPP